MLSVQTRCCLAASSVATFTSSAKAPCKIEDCECDMISTTKATLHHQFEGDSSLDQVIDKVVRAILLTGHP